MYGIAIVIMSMLCMGMKNEYGLDADYFKNKLFPIVRDIYYFTPEELKRELEKLVSVLKCEINNLKGE